MTRGLTIQAGVAAIAFAAGATLLARPAAIRRAMQLPDGEGATYGLRIIGMMLTALGLFLGGFAVIFAFYQ